MTESIFQQELMLIKQVNQKNVCFVITGIFYRRTLVMDHIFVMVVIMTQKSIDSKNIDIVYFKGNAYRIYFWHMSKHKSKRKLKAISLMTNSNLINKTGIL